MRPLPRALSYSIPSIFCYIYVVSLLLGPSHQHGLFKFYLLTKLVLKKGPRILPIPIPIKIPQEAKIVKVPIMHTSQHVHIHYHGPPPHEASPNHHVPGRTIHDELVREGFSALNRIDHGHMVKTTVANHHGHQRQSTPDYFSFEEIQRNAQASVWPLSGYLPSGPRQVLAWPQL